MSNLIELPVLPDSLDKFIFVRHGQTQLNALRRMQFQLDEPLNDTGRLQASNASDVLLKMPGHSYHFIYSTYSRAAETAGIIASKIIKEGFKYSPHCVVRGCSPDVGLIERFGGSLDGISQESFFKLMEEKIPEDVYPWDNLHHICPKIEASSKIVNRVAGAISFGAEQAVKSSSTLVVVGHNGSFLTFVRLVLGITDDILFSNAVPYLFEKKNGVWNYKSLD